MTMYKLSLKQLTLLKRSLTIIGALLIAWHLVTAGYIANLDAQWYLEHRQWQHSLTNILLGFGNWVIWGAIFIFSVLMIVYEAAKIEYKSRPWQRTVLVLLPLSIALSVVVGYCTMLDGIASGARPETVAQDGFFQFLLGSLSVAALLTIGFIVVQIVKDLWAPAQKESKSSYSFSSSDTDKSKSGRSKTSMLLLGFGLGCLLGLFD
jgi:hypothetical protein